MGQTPSVQDDLLALKQLPAKSSKRRDAFRRVQGSMKVTTLPQQDLLKACAAVEALRFDVWPAPPEGASKLTQEQLADRVRGCLFGAALGDAAGLSAEFMSKAEVLDFYGPAADFCPGREVHPDEHRLMWCAGDWTDDTDQQLLILQSLLHCQGRYDGVDFAGRLLTWRKEGFGELGDVSAAGLGQTTKLVLNDAHFAEAPQEAARRHSLKVPSNGGVMRAAVCGIPEFWDPKAVAATAEQFCRATHAEPRCVASSVAVALLVSGLLRGEDLEPLVEGVLAGLPPEWQEEMRRHADAELEELKLDDRAKIGYTLKCFGAGLWALRQDAADTFRRSLNRLIQEGGDADTNGTVAGALLGCRLGFSQLPKDWIAGMPYSSWLEAYAQKLLFMLRLR